MIQQTKKRDYSKLEREKKHNRKRKVLPWGDFAFFVVFFFLYICSVERNAFPTRKKECGKQSAKVSPKDCIRQDRSETASSLIPIPKESLSDQKDKNADRARF